MITSTRGRKSRSHADTAKPEDPTRTIHKRIKWNPFGAFRRNCPRRSDKRTNGHVFSNLWSKRRRRNPLRQTYIKTRIQMSREQLSNDDEATKPKRIASFHLSSTDLNALSAAYKYSPIVYSDLYFKHGLPLNGKIVHHGCLTQLANGTLYQRPRIKYTKKYDASVTFNYEEQTQSNQEHRRPGDELFVTENDVIRSKNYMPLYLSDDIKTRNFRALILIDYNVSVDRILINNQDFKTKCMGKKLMNELSFSRYNGMIRLESTGQVFEEYFFEKSFEEYFVRCKGYSVNRINRRDSVTKTNVYSGGRSANQKLDLNAITYDISFSERQQRSTSASPGPPLRRSPIPFNSKHHNLSQSMLELLDGMGAGRNCNATTGSPKAVEKFLHRRQKMLEQQMRHNYSGHLDVERFDLDKWDVTGDPKIWEPLLLLQQQQQGQHHERPLIDEQFTCRKARLSRAEQQKITRITIGYTMAFFLLTIITFFILYFT